MREKYDKAGLNYDIILEKFPDMQEYEKTLMFYFDDENFELLGQYIKDEDYAMAKDACKGLYVLASELRVFPLYEALLEVYEDLEFETYSDISEHYKQMHELYDKIRSAFYA